MTDLEFLQSEQRTVIEHELRDMDLTLAQLPKDKHYTLGYLPHNLQSLIKFHGTDAQQHKFDQIVKVYELDKAYFQIR